MIATIDQSKCDRCGTCISVCPTNALLLLCDELVIDGARCSGCAVCVTICPFAALGMSELHGASATATLS